MTGRDYTVRSTAGVSSASQHVAQPRRMSQQIRHRDDHDVRLEQKGRADVERRIVVQQMLPPAARHDDRGMQEHQQSLPGEPDLLAEPDAVRVDGRQQPDDERNDQHHDREINALVRIGGRDRRDAAGDRYRDREDVVGEQRGRRDQSFARPEIVLGHGVRPAAARVREDRLAIRQADRSRTRPTRSRRRTARRERSSCSGARARAVPGERPAEQHVLRARGSAGHDGLGDARKDLTYPPGRVDT